MQPPSPISAVTTESTSSLGIPRICGRQFRIRSMRRRPFIFGVTLVGVLLAAAPALPARAADDPAPAPAVSCSNGIVGSVSCIASKQDRKQAKNAFDRGIKLLNNERLEEAFAQFDQASKLVPQSAQFLTARERVKAQLVFNHVERGNALLMEMATS